MHLSVVRSTSVFKEAKAYLSCVWLTHDLAVPYTRSIKGKIIKIKQPYKAALAFAGPDVVEFGFLPGRDIIYVISMSGTYLVPYRLRAVKEDKE